MEQELILIQEEETETAEQKLKKKQKQIFLTSKNLKIIFNKDAVRTKKENLGPLFAKEHTFWGNIARRRAHMHAYFSARA